MRKIYLYLFITACMVMPFISACSGFLEVSPSTELSSSEAIQNLDEAEGALLGVYTSFMSNSEYYGRQFVSFGDVRGDDMATRVNGARDYSQYTFGHALALTSTNGGNFWVKLYLMHNRANSLLERIEAGSIPVANDDEQKTLNNIQGEALAIRALLRFDLVRIYGEPYLKNKDAWGIAIPDHVVGKDEKIQRSTVEQTYTVILRDLTAALALISDTKTTPGRFNIWSVKALMARVYLYMGNYDMAYELSTDVIKNGGYTLISNANYVSSWAQEFTTESVFEAYTSTVENADRESIGYTWALNGYAAAIVTNNLLDLLNEDPDDVRLKLLTPYAISATVTQTFIKKYPGRDNLYVNNARIIRLSDLYLIAAESALRSGKTDASFYLNKIRQRANPALPEVTATLDLVEKERRKELFGEGHRFFDITRALGTREVHRSGAPSSAPITTADQVPVISWNNAQTYLLILPIPQTEIDSNPDIHQNNGYPTSN